MKYSLLALAATTLLSSSASARGHHHRRHAHPAALAPYGECQVVPAQCTTYTSSILVPVGEYLLNPYLIEGGLVLI